MENYKKFFLYKISSYLIKFFPYYYLDLETDFGVISLVIPAQQMDAAPVEDGYVCGTGILSLDVALPHATETEDAFDEDVYDRISTDPGRTYYRF